LEKTGIYSATLAGPSDVLFELRRASPPRVPAAGDDRAPPHQEGGGSKRGLAALIPPQEMGSNHTPFQSVMPELLPAPVRSGNRPRFRKAITRPEPPSTGFVARKPEKSVSGSTGRARPPESASPGFRLPNFTHRNPERGEETGRSLKGARVSGQGFPIGRRDQQGHCPARPIEQGRQQPACPSGTHRKALRRQAKREMGGVFRDWRERRGRAQEAGNKCCWLSPDGLRLKRQCQECDSAYDKD